MKGLNLKNMKDALIYDCNNNEEMTQLWNEFYHLYQLGFISRETWVKFFDCCRGWYFDETDSVVCVRDAQKCVRDSRNEDAIVFRSM